MAQQEGEKAFFNDYKKRKKKKKNNNKMCTENIKYYQYTPLQMNRFDYFIISISTNLECF